MHSGSSERRGGIQWIFKMAHKRNSKGTLPNLSLAEAHHKADQYSMSDLHRQTNAAAKQAILHELHSLMQLRAERIRLHRKGSSDNHEFGGSGHFHEVSGKGPVTQVPVGNVTKHVTFHEAPPEPRAQSRIPVPVRPDSGRPDPGQRLRGQQTTGGPRQTGRGRTGPIIRRGGDGDGQQGQRTAPVTYEYTWGQRGRLNELRIRFLARKYFKTWKRNACAGVRPSVIRKHYNSWLLRKMFDEWREFWWTQRREWTLMIRAEYHHRYKIYQHVWMSWRAFVIREKVKNAKKEISTIHASNVLLNKAMTAWRQYVMVRRAKAVLLLRAKKFHQRHALQLCWKEWKAAVQQRKEEEEAEVFALQYWAESLTQRAWNAWKRRWRERQEMKDKEKHARCHFEKKLIARCYYQGLVPYTVHRREKKKINAHAYQVYTDRLLTNAWQHWNQRWFTRRSLAQRQEQVDHLGNRSRLRRALIHWRFYIHLVHIDRRKEDMARTHHNTQLKKLGLLMLRLTVVQRRVKVRRSEQATELHQHMLVKRCWNQWILQCEHREELKLFSATRKARHMHRKRVLTSLFQQWCNYTLWRRHRKEQYARADDYYFRRNLLPKCIQKLRSNAELEKRKRALQAQAAEFYREGQLGRCFYRWCRSFQTSQDIRMMERMAFLHHENILAKRFFAEWRERTRSKLKESEKMYNAMDHYHMSLCRQVLNRWMEFTAEAKQRSEFERTAAVHAYMQRVKNSWGMWRQYVSYRKRKAAKRSRADFYHHRKEIRKVFIAWKQHCLKMQGIYQVVAVKEAAVNHRRLRCAFSDWRDSVEAAQEERSLERIAVHHWNTRILGKVMTAWHTYAQQHAANSAVKAWRLEQLQEQLSKGKLERAFQAWKQCAKTDAEEKRKEMKADAFHQEILRQRCFQQWKAFRLLCIKKALMARQAMWLNKIRMQAKFFSSWKHQLSEAQEENKKTVMALWLWSMKLQQRTLHAWMGYARERQRKKARITEALELRRQELQREGVRQWLMVAGSLGERRAAVAAKHHALTSLKSYQVVQRCAARWRQKTISNRGKKKHHDLTQRRVRFEDEEPSRDQGSKVTVPLPTQRSSMVIEPVGSRGLPSLSNSVDARLQERGIRERTVPAISKTVTGKVRPQPRRPDFLRDSLQREGLWSQSPLQADRNTSEEHDNTRVQNVRIPTFVLQKSNETALNSMWTVPSDVSKPIRTTKPLPKNVPTESRGVTRSTGYEGESTLPSTSALESETVPDGRDDKRIPSDYASSESGLHRMGDNVTMSQSDTVLHRDNREIIERIPAKNATSTSSKNRLHSGDDVRMYGLSGSGDNVSHIDRKPPVLLPPSAFSSGLPTAARIAPQDTGISHPSFKNVNTLPSRASHVPFTVNDTKRLGDEEQCGEDKNRTDSQETLYAEIQRLKNTLQGYQDMKSKLKRLRSQEAELQTWVKELNLPSSTEDSAALLIGDELTQVQEEIDLLSSQLHQRKPHIKNILSQITRLTQQTTG